MLDARATVEPSHYRPLLEWMAELSATQLAEVAQTPVGYDELSGIYVRAPSASLEHELLWITERIRIEPRRLSAFVAACSELQQTIFVGR